MGDVIELRTRQAREANDDVVYLETVRGDSVEPTARAGDVWVYRAAGRFDRPGIYLFSDGQCYPVAKRLEPVPGRPGRVRVNSDNSLYGPQEVDLAGLQILGGVVGIVTALGLNKRLHGLPDFNQINTYAVDRFSVALDVRNRLDNEC